MLTLIKQLFCRHTYQDDVSHVVYGEDGPSGHIKESRCLKCFKVRQEFLKFSAYAKKG